MFEWLRRWRSGTQSDGRATREPAPKVDPIEDLLRIVNDAQERDAENERRLGDPAWRNRPISYRGHHKVCAANNAKLDEA
jgi:hypothetical protein